MNRHGPLPGWARAALVVAGLGVAFGVLQATMLYVGLKQEKDLPFEEIGRASCRERV